MVNTRCATLGIVSAAGAAAAVGGAVAYNHHSDSQDQGPGPGSVNLRELFFNCKDLPEGMSHERFMDLLQRMDGLNDDERHEMTSACDRNGDGIIDADEFTDWFHGDSICDEDRDVLRSGL